MDHKEIERRWLIDSPDSLLMMTGENISYKYIAQYYIGNTRYRRINYPIINNDNINYTGYYVKTNKEKVYDNDHIVTIEHNIPISFDEYSKMMPQTIKVKHIEKVRSIIPANSNIGMVNVEFDVFHNEQLHDLFIVEIEFKDTDDYDNFDGKLLFSNNRCFDLSEYNEITDGKLSNKSLFMNLNCNDTNDWLLSEIDNIKSINNKPTISSLEEYMEDIDND